MLHKNKRSVRQLKPKEPRTQKARGVTREQFLADLKKAARRVRPSREKASS